MRVASDDRVQTGLQLLLGRSAGVQPVNVFDNQQIGLASAAAQFAQHLHVLVCGALLDQLGGRQIGDQRLGALPLEGTSQSPTEMRLAGAGRPDEGQRVELALARKHRFHHNRRQVILGVDHKVAQRSRTPIGVGGMIICGAESSWQGDPVDAVHSGPIRERKGSINALWGQGC